MAVLCRSCMVKNDLSVGMTVWFPKSKIRFIDRQKVWKMRQRGMSHRAIAKKLGHHVRSIFSVLQKHDPATYKEPVRTGIRLCERCRKRNDYLLGRRVYIGDNNAHLYTPEWKTKAVERIQCSNENGGWVRRKGLSVQWATELKDGACVQDLIQAVIQRLEFLNTYPEYKKVNRLLNFVLWRFYRGDSMRSKFEGHKRYA